MKLQTVLDRAKEYKQIATLIALHLKCDQGIRGADAAKTTALLNLFSIEVSSVSRFEDQLWYFPEAREKQAKTLGASRFRIDFSAYGSVPQPIVVQVKLVFLMMMLIPQSEIGGGARKGKAIKIQTLAPMFKGWLSFVDHVFSRMSLAFGTDVVRDNFQSLDALKRNHYVEYAEGFRTSPEPARWIERVFDFFQAKRVHDLLFDKHVVSPDLRQTKAIVSEAEKDDREKILSDQLFERVSAISGYIVVDFLRKLGVKIADKKSAELMRNFPFEIDSDLVDIDWVILDNYSAMRLIAKGHPYDTVTQCTGSSNLFTEGRSERYFRNALVEYIDVRKYNIDSVNDVRAYLDLVYKAAVYIIAQFTGMRPSELIDVRVDSHIEDSFGIPCIISAIRKHQDAERSLFDDKWVCIPAMLDALEASRIISKTRANPFLLSKSETVAFCSNPDPMSAGGLKHILKTYFQEIVPGQYDEANLFPYVLRHTLAYQLFKADLGLPFISHQLKHFGNLVGSYSSASNKGFSEVTLGYGDIGQKLSGSDTRGKTLRHKAEVEAVKAAYDPDAAYAGINAGEHSKRMEKIFQGYMSAGYSKDEVFEAMAEQGMAITNVGTGMCYGGKAEDFDDRLPCIGGLRCNPVRCRNAVVTEAHIPKWREVYTENLKVVEMGESGLTYTQALEAVNEARMVLESLNRGGSSQKTQEFLRKGGSE